MAQAVAARALARAGDLLGSPAPERRRRRGLRLRAPAALTLRGIEAVDRAVQLRPRAGPERPVPGALSVGDYARFSGNSAAATLGEDPSDGRGPEAPPALRHRLLVALLAPRRRVVTGESLRHRPPPEAATRTARPPGGRSRTASRVQSPAPDGGSRLGPAPSARTLCSTRPTGTARRGDDPVVSKRSTVTLLVAGQRVTGGQRAREQRASLDRSRRQARKVPPVPDRGRAWRARSRAARPGRDGRRNSRPAAAGVAVTRRQPPGARTPRGLVAAPECGSPRASASGRSTSGGEALRNAASAGFRSAAGRSRCSPRTRRDAHVCVPRLPAAMTVLVPLAAATPPGKCVPDDFGSRRIRTEPADILIAAPCSTACS